MKKSDLKTGMMIEYNNGDRAIVLHNVDTQHYGNQDLFFAGERGFMTGDSYGEDLICRDEYSSSFTIRKVYAAPSESNILDRSLWGRILLWEREPEPIEMTLQEAKQKLEEVTGKPIKITI